MPDKQEDHILETNRMLIRRIREDDVDLLARILSDPETMRYYPSALEREGVEAWIARRLHRYQEHGTGLWACFLKDGDEFVGQCGLEVQHVDGVDELEVGYLFVRKYWGLGLATEAARGCLTYAFEILRRPRVIALIRPENTPSIRVAERLGMHAEKQTMHNNVLHSVYVIEKD